MSFEKRHPEIAGDSRPWACGDARGESAPRSWIALAPWYGLLTCAFSVGLHPNTRLQTSKLMSVGQRKVGRKQFLQHGLPSTLFVKFVISVPRPVQRQKDQAEHKRGQT